jgi:hypothetical protein
VEVRSVWPREDAHFTPWLAQTENLALLSEILKLGPLAIESTEVPVGSFFIDILARDSGAAGWSSRTSSARLTIPTSAKS